MALLLDGRPVAKQLQLSIQDQLTKLTLGILLVGDYPPSLSYIAQKQKLADKLGVTVLFEQLPTNTTTDQVMSIVDRWNDDAAVTGMIVQLPLPDHIDRDAVLDRICPYKDVDGLNPWSLGKLLEGQPMLVSATARGVIELLNYYQLPIVGQHVVVVGRSTLVGKPTGLLLLGQGATLTFAHRQTADVASMTRQADILVVAAGHPGLITNHHVQPGAVVVDVGLTKTEDGLKGDVDFAAVEPIVKAISPVPGGVGPLTVSCLFKNLVQAASLQHQSGHRHGQSSAIH